MTNLEPCDLDWCINRLPNFLPKLLKLELLPVVIAGGFVRAAIAREPVADIDLFVSSKKQAEELAQKVSENDRSRIINTPNAITIRRRDSNAPPIQIIHRWVFERPEHVMPSFDFTIAQAGFWFNRVPGIAAHATDGQWNSLCCNRFYQDLAAKRLVYTSPVRIEDAGGSLLRVLKFYQKGYRIPLDSLAAVMARMVKGININEVPLHVESIEGKSIQTLQEYQVATVLYGLLREVDPALPGHEHYERGIDLTTRIWKDVPSELPPELQHPGYGEAA